MLATEYSHQTVMCDSAVDALLVDDDGVYIDCTFGRGGHSQALLERLGARARVIALDRDPQALEAGLSLARRDPRFAVIRARFSDLQSLLEERGLSGTVSGVLFDLGVSSPQLDQAERGFSFLRDGPLDMRMDPEQGISAAEWLNSAKEAEIADVLRRFGEEKFSRRMARAIVVSRSLQPLASTAQLAVTVAAANPAWERDRHPATRAFQAIRIFINNELDEISTALEQSVKVLRPGGRLAVISFHSLEDRIVKKFISLQIKGDNFPRGLPVTASQMRPMLTSVGKPLRADAQEIQGNPRARSAILRVAERLSGTAG